MAHKLCDDAGMVFVEDINFQTWTKWMLGKHTLDGGFGQFLTMWMARFAERWLY